MRTTAVTGPTNDDVKRLGRTAERVPRARGAAGRQANALAPSMERSSGRGSSAELGSAVEPVTHSGAAQASIGESVSGESASNVGCPASGTGRAHEAASRSHEAVGRAYEAVGRSCEVVEVVPGGDCGSGAHKPVPRRGAIAGAGAASIEGTIEGTISPEKPVSRNPAISPPLRSTGASVSMEAASKGGPIATGSTSSGGGPVDGDPSTDRALSRNREWPRDPTGTGDHAGPGDREWPGGRSRSGDRTEAGERTGYRDHAGSGNRTRAGERARPGDRGRPGDHTGPRGKGAASGALTPDETSTTRTTRRPGTSGRPGDTRRSGDRSATQGRPRLWLVPPPREETDPADGPLPRPGTRRDAQVRPDAGIGVRRDGGDGVRNPGREARRPMGISEAGDTGCAGTSAQREVAARMGSSRRRLAGRPGGSGPEVRHRPGGSGPEVRRRSGKLDAGVMRRDGRSGGPGGRGRGSVAGRASACRRGGRRSSPPVRLTRRGRAVVVIGMVLLSLGGFWLGTRTAAPATVRADAPGHAMVAPDASGR